MESRRADTCQMAIRIHGVRYTMDQVLSVQATQRGSWSKRFGIIFTLGVIACVVMFALGTARPDISLFQSQNRFELLGIMMACLLAGGACFSRPATIYSLRINLPNARPSIYFTNKYRAISFLQSLVNANEQLKLVDRDGSWADAVNV